MPKGTNHHACWGYALETVDGFFFDLSAIELFFFLAGPGSLPPSLDVDEVGVRRRHWGMTTDGGRRFSSPFLGEFGRLTPQKVRLARRRLGHALHVRDHVKEFLKVVVQDDEHCQSEVGSRGEHFLDDLIVVIELVKDEGDAFHGDRPSIDR